MLLSEAIEAEGRIEANPARKIKIPQPKRREPKGIDREDLVALLATTEGGGVADRRDRAIMFFLADTGCRVGGLCGLRVQDVDLERGLAVVTEKGGRARLVPFLPLTGGAVSDWLEVRAEDQGPWVFVSLGNKARGALSPGGVAQMLKRRARRAGVTGPVNPHAFRHAFAREYLMSGGDLGTIEGALMVSTAGLQQSRGGRLPDYLTTEEVASTLGYHVKYVRKMARDGKLSADKKSGIWLIPREVVEAYKEAIRGKAKHDPTRGT